MVGGWSHTRRRRWSLPYVECPACDGRTRDSQGNDCKLCGGKGKVSVLAAKEFEKVSTDRQSEAAGDPF